MMATSAPTSMDTAAGSSEGSQTHRVKWCSAHITIAKQIQAHQQQTKVCVYEHVCMCVLVKVHSALYVCEYNLYV